MRNLPTILFASAMMAFALAPVAGAAALSHATLASPVAGAKSVIIDGKMWKCTDVNCFAPAAGSGQPLARECARAVKVLGKVTAFTRDGQALDEKGLAVCNAGA